MFAEKQLVRVIARPDTARPSLGWIASRPMGMKDVPAMGVFYFVIAPDWRGFVNADRLIAASAWPALPRADVRRRRDIEPDP
jgi:hypothetical protein